MTKPSGFLCLSIKQVEQTDRLQVWQHWKSFMRSRFSLLCQKSRFCMFQL